LKGYDKIVVDNQEAYAANTLRINDSLIMPEGFPATKKKLSRMGLPVVELDVSEVAKMDGGLTCLSLRL
jgi:dimethylargininase